MWGRNVKEATLKGSEPFTGSNIVAYKKNRVREQLFIILEVFDV